MFVFTIIYIWSVVDHDSNRFSPMPSRSYLESSKHMFAVRMCRFAMYLCWKIEKLEVHPTGTLEQIMMLCRPRSSIRAKHRPASGSANTYLHGFLLSASIVRAKVIPKLMVTRPCCGKNGLRGCFVGKAEVQ
jgi:hypothetical protein